jgi:hypothetical protein
MAARNLFRFVSVRPPISETEEDQLRLINKEAGEQLVQDVLTRQEEHGESLPVARRAVSAAFIESAEYFSQSDIWKDLRPRRKHFQDLIAGVCHKVEEPGEDAYVEAELREIESILGKKLRHWVAHEGESFASAKKILWHSYYANVLAPELRPNDRSEMLDWIRTLASLELLRPPSDDVQWKYDEQGCASVEQLNRARVNMPQELFAEKPPLEDPVPVEPEDNVKEDVDTLRASFERLQAARRDLDKLYRHKVNALRLAPPPAGGPGDAEPAPPKRADDGVPSHSSSEGAQSARPPWLLTEEDAEQLTELGAELNRLGVPLAGSLVPDVAAALDEATAANTAALAALEGRVDVLGIGPTMALVQRTVRGFRPGPRGGVGSGEQAEQDEEGAT